MRVEVAKLTKDAFALRAEVEAKGHEIKRLNEDRVESAEAMDELRQVARTKGDEAVALEAKVASLKASFALLNETHEATVAQHTADVEARIAKQKGKMSSLKEVSCHA